MADTPSRGPNTRNITAAQLLTWYPFPDSIKLVAVDLPTEQLFVPDDARWEPVSWFDASLMDVGDDFVAAFAACEHLGNVRWISLEGNAKVTIVGVRAICEAVRDGRLPALDTVVLDRTRCNASPYLLNDRWNPTKLALQLMRQYGRQYWLTMDEEDLLARTRQKQASKSK